jgi:uncharacterized protein YjeT (DUF2065 family)
LYRVGLPYKAGNTQRVYEIFFEGQPVISGGLSEICAGDNFFLGARECDVTWVIAVFGSIFLLSGLLIFMLGLEKAKGIINWYLEQPSFMFRVVASIVLCVGLIIVYAA